jgi:hypothetical protein
MAASATGMAKGWAAGKGMSTVARRWASIRFVVPNVINYN